MAKDMGYDAVLLAAAGLLDGKRVATHWANCERLARKFPALEVDADSLYVVDGKIWTTNVGLSGIHRLDLATGKWETFDAYVGQPKNRRRGIYQVVSDSLVCTTR